MKNREQSWRFREGCTGEGGEDGAQKMGLQRLKHILTFTYQEVHHRRLLKEGQLRTFLQELGTWKKSSTAWGSTWWGRPLPSMGPKRRLCTALWETMLCEGVLSLPTTRSWKAGTGICFPLFSHVHPTSRIVFETKLLINTNKWMN